MSCEVISCELLSSIVSVSFNGSHSVAFWIVKCPYNSLPTDLGDMSREKRVAPKIYRKGPRLDEVLFCLALFHLPSLYYGLDANSSNTELFHTALCAV